MVNSELSKFLVMLKNCQIFSSKNVRTFVLNDSIDSSALTCAITGTDSSKKRQLLKIIIENAGPTSNFLVTVATSQLENPIESVELQFKFADSEVVEKFMKHFAQPLNRLYFLQRKNDLLVGEQCIITFSYVSMQLQTELIEHQKLPTLVVTTQNSKTLQESTSSYNKNAKSNRRKATDFSNESIPFEQDAASFKPPSLNTVNYNTLARKVNKLSENPVASRAFLFCWHFDINSCTNQVDKTTEPNGPSIHHNNRHWKQKITKFSCWEAQMTT